MSKNSLKIAEEKLRAVFKKNKVNYEDIEVQLDPKLMSESWPHWPSGSVAIDYLIGGKPNEQGVPPCPGYPKGKVINVYGLEGSGKSTLALTAAAAINARGGTVVYIDCEHEVDLRYALKIGVNVHDDSLFRLLQPETMEQALIIALASISAGVDLVVWDSAGAAMPEAEHEKSEKEMEATAKIGALAKKWSEKLPILKARAAKTGTIFMGISQMRHSISSFGPGEKHTVQGGLAWKYYSALRIKITRIAWDKGDTTSALENKPDKGVVGQLVKVKLDKCKVSNQQNMEVQMYLRWGHGIDDFRTIIETAIRHGLIKKKGSWLSWDSPDGDEVRFQGVEKFRSYFVEESNKNHFEALKTQVMEKLTGGTTEVSDDDEEEEEVEFSLDEELEEILT